jgi:hypothetical protein
MMLTGEMELWFALAKVILVVLFIIVGLIYDWGGVLHHSGPASALLMMQRRPDAHVPSFRASPTFGMVRPFPGSPSSRRRSASPSTHSESRWLCWSEIMILTFHRRC